MSAAAGKRDRRRGQQPELPLSEPEAAEPPECGHRKRVEQAIADFGMRAPRWARRRGRR